MDFGFVGWRGYKVAGIRSDDGNRWMGASARAAGVGTGNVYSGEKAVSVGGRGG